MSSNTREPLDTVIRERMEILNKHKSVGIWFAGLSGSGKSTLSCLLKEQLQALGCRVYIIDGDSIRQGLCKGLGYSIADRTENIRRIAEVTKLVSDAGLITLTAVISPIRSIVTALEISLKKETLSKYTANVI